MVTKEEARQFRKESLADHCLICGASEARLVCDHNHQTNRIRGTLCELCNSWLGTYEANKKRIKQRGRAKYKAWVARYKEKIEEHLARDTGLPYWKDKTCLVSPNLVRDAH